MFSPVQMRGLSQTPERVTGVLEVLEVLEIIQGVLEKVTGEFKDSAGDSTILKEISGFLMGFP